MIKLFTTTLFIFSFAFANAQTSSSAYFNDLESFYGDVLHEDGTYSYKDFARDSASLTNNKSFYKKIIKTSLKAYYDDFYERNDHNKELISPFDGKKIYKSKKFIDSIFYDTCIDSRYNLIDTCQAEVRIKSSYWGHHCLDGFVVFTKPLNVYDSRIACKLQQFCTKDRISFTHFDVDTTFDNPFDTIVSYKELTTYSPCVSLDSVIHDVTFITTHDLELYKNPFLSEKFLDEMYDKKIKGVLLFSVPVFNKDKTLAYMEWEDYVSALNAHGYKGLFKKVNNKWVAAWVQMLWVS